MGKEISSFGNIEIEKKFTAIKSYFLKDLYIEKVLVSKRVSFDEKKL